MQQGMLIGSDQHLRWHARHKVQASEARSDISSSDIWAVYKDSPICSLVIRSVDTHVTMLCEVCVTRWLNATIRASLQRVP